MVYQSATTPIHTSNGAHTPVNGSSRSSQTGSGTGTGTGIGTGTGLGSGSGSALSHSHSKKLIIRRRSSRSSSAIAPVKSSVSSRSAISEVLSCSTVSQDLRNELLRYYPESMPEPVPSQSLRSKKLIQIMPEEAGGTAWQVEDEPFYHGFMSNNECKPLLTNAGDFLVRRAEIDGEMQYVITVLPENSNEITNFIIKKTRPKHLYYVYIYAFKTISDLIAYHSRMKKPLNNENVCILKGIARSDWQLAHEQVNINLLLYLMVKICSPPGMPPMMQQIMFSCLTYDPKNRPTFQELNVKLSAARPSSSYFTLSSKIKGLFHF
ncbi:unnamed protein product [Brugia timori]|uniref:SH2 domain-containing protein n=1 Tax=Brugia timori TaxID=42155 RepID=A0A0R3QT20_9BILA|nr:unnamed protein product [Brugia timori]